MLKMTFMPLREALILHALTVVLLFTVHVFCCSGAEDYSIDYNCVNGILIFLPFTFLLSGCHIHFQEFRNEMCDILIPGKYYHGYWI